MFKAHIANSCFVFQTKSGKELVAFLFNDFLLLTTGSLSGSGFSFNQEIEKSFDIPPFKDSNSIPNSDGSLNLFHRKMLESNI